MIDADSHHRAVFDQEVERWSGLYLRSGRRASWGILDRFIAGRAKRRMALALDMLELNSGHLLADIGCGSGYYGLRAHSQTGCGYLGLDLSREMLRHARKLFSPSGAKGEFMQCDARNLPLQSSCADKILLVGVLNYYDKHQVGSILREVQRVLKPGGAAVLTSLRLDLLTWLRSRLPEFFPRPLRLPGPIFPHSERKLLPIIEASGLRPDRVIRVRKYGIFPFYSLVRVRRSND